MSVNVTWENFCLSLSSFFLTHTHKLHSCSKKIVNHRSLNWLLGGGSKWNQFSFTSNARRKPLLVPTTSSHYCIFYRDLVPCTINQHASLRNCLCGPLHPVATLLHSRSYSIYLPLLKQVFLFFVTFIQDSFATDKQAENVYLKQPTNISITRVLTPTHSRTTNSPGGHELYESGVKMEFITPISGFCLLLSAE